MEACAVNSSGNIIPLDVSSLANFQAFVGYANARIPASTSGPVIASGRLLNVTTSYAVGTPLYIDTTGNPTSTYPAIGVNGFLAGYACIFMGVVVQNALNPSEKDISIFSQVIGVL